MLASTALREARRRAGLTQRELAARAEVPQSTIGRIESGAIDPRVSTLDRLLRLCGDELDAVPRKGIGIDRSLLRENLKRSWIERIEYGVASARGMERFRRIARTQ